MAARKKTPAPHAKAFYPPPQGTPAAVRTLFCELVSHAIGPTAKGDTLHAIAHQLRKELEAVGSAVTLPKLSVSVKR